MDRTELERLMDRYKKEMMEFTRKNGVVGEKSDSTVRQIDKRESEMKKAADEKRLFERDRSDPLPKPPAEKEPKIEETAASKNEAVAVQARVSQTEEVPSDSLDVVKTLRENCELISQNANATNEQKERCRDINDFLTANTESGTLRVEAYASDRAFGVGSARVMIFLPLESGNVMVFDGITDIDGISDNVRLPAPPGELSLSPSASSGKLPYAVYTVYVEHPGFVRALFSNVPVFSGIESVQPVRMLAKAAGIDEPEPVVVDETDRSSLQR